jgi:hypothetical protein
MNSEYTRALVDAANAADEEAKTYRAEMEKAGQSGDDRAESIWLGKLNAVANFAARLRAWAKATPTPPPDAGERCGAVCATIQPQQRPCWLRPGHAEEWHANGGIQWTDSGGLAIQPSPPPPAGEVEAWPAHWPKRYNGCSDPCDALFFACACGAFHDAEEVAEFEREYGPRKPPPAGGERCNAAIMVDDSLTCCRQPKGHAGRHSDVPPPAPQGDDVIESLAKKHGVTVEDVRRSMKFDATRVGAPGSFVRACAAFMVDVIDALRANGGPR